MGTVQPKTFVSVEAKKLFIKNLFNYLNDIQLFTAYFHNYDWLCHLATLFIGLVLFYTLGVFVLQTVTHTEGNDTHTLNRAWNNSCPLGAVRL